MKNVVVVVGDTAEIELTQGKKVTVDIVDLPKVTEYNWRAYRSRSYSDGKLPLFYAAASVPAPHTKTKQTTLYMHRLIVGCRGRVDHINNDGLDNRRANLRECEQYQNLANSRKRQDNTTGFKGVWWCKRKQRFVAEIKHQGKKYWLGQFTTAEEAGAAYRRGTERLNGEFARTS